MGEETDGSSMAAQGALPDEQADRPGLWGRLKEVLITGGEDSAPEEDEEAAGSGTAPFGMGNLRRMRVEDVALPKVEIEAVPVDISMEDLVSVFRESGMSRLPVFEGTLDTPLGLVHLKDFALKYGFNGKHDNFELRPLLRPLLYAPPSMPIGVLLQKMQSGRMHMALVIDEYGGVDGLVTIEDLIEQVIGEIEDEHDVDEGQFWSLEAPGAYLVQARAPLEEFEAEIGQSLSAGAEDEEIDTLGGLVFLMAGRVPVRGEVIRHDSGVEFEVIDADPRRLKRLRVRLPREAATDPQDG